MLRKNTSQIVEAGKNACREYKARCDCFFGSPGDEGTERRKSFINMLKTIEIKNETPERAFSKLYQFYKNEREKSLRSRFVVILQNHLALLLGIRLYTRRVAMGRHLHGYQTIGFEEFIRAAERIFNYANQMKALEKQKENPTLRDDFSYSL